MTIWSTTTVLTNGALGGNATNSWHFRTIDGPPVTVEGQLDAALTKLHDMYVALATVLDGGTHVSMDGVFVSVMEDDPIMIDRDGWGIDLGGFAPVMPPSQCLCISWKTASPTRSGHGRTFLGPLQSTTLDTGTGKPTNAALDTVRGQASSLVDFSDLEGNGAFGVYSKGTPTHPGPIFRDFTGSSVARKFAVLRSRRD